MGSGGLVLGAGQHRDELVGSVVPHQALRLQSQLGHRLLGQRLDPGALFQPGQLVAVRRVDQRLEVLAERAHGRPGGGQGRFGLDPVRLRPGPLRGGPGQRQLHLLGQILAGDVHRLGGRGLADQPGPPRLLLGPGLPLIRRGPAQRLGAPGQGPVALLQRAQGQPGVHLRRPGQPGRVGQPVALSRIRLDVVDRLGQLQPALEVGQPGDVAVPGLLRPDDRLLAAGRLPPAPTGPSS